MSDPLQITEEIAPAPRPIAGFVEKAPLECYVPPEKPSLVGMSRAALAGTLAGIGVPAAARKMRVQQLWHWLYVRGAQSFDEMTNVSKELRALLDANFTLARPQVVAEQTSVDGTRKWLLRLPGEHAGEAPHATCPPAKVSPAAHSARAAPSPRSQPSGAVSEQFLR